MSNTSFIGIVAAGLFISLLVPAIVFIRAFKRCPADRVLVVFGRVFGHRSAECVHGGGRLVWPMIQDHGWLSLEPADVEVVLPRVLDRRLQPLNVEVRAVIAVSTQREILQCAAERLLGLPPERVVALGRRVLQATVRATVSAWTHDELGDTEPATRALMDNTNVELNRLGLTAIHLDIVGVEAAGDLPPGVRR